MQVTLNDLGHNAIPSLVSSIKKNRFKHAVMKVPYFNITFATIKMAKSHIN